MSKEIVVLTGPMSGLPFDNHPTFNAAAKMLREVGYDVVNPAETKLSAGATWGEMVGSRLQVIRDIHKSGKEGAIAVLPGNETSDGCTIECCLASHYGWGIDLVTGILLMGIMAKKEKQNDR